MSPSQTLTAFGSGVTATGLPETTPRIIPAIVAAAFVAAARVVPRLLPVLKPFAKKGASAFLAAVKKHAPGKVWKIVDGALTLLVFEAIKRALGW